MTSELTPAQEAMSLIVAAFPVPSWEPETLRLYADRLADLPAAAVKAAVLEWIDTRTERPTIAELRGAAVGMANRLRMERRRQLRQHADPDDDVPVDRATGHALLIDLRQRLERKLGKP